MDFPIHIDVISIDLLILYFRGAQVKISIFSSPEAEAQGELL